MIFDDVVSFEMTQHVINNFESSNHVRRDIISSSGNKICFDEINVSASPGWELTNDYVFDIIQEYTQVYRSMMEIPNYAWPQKFGYEECRMKRYLPNNNDRFDEHVDVLDHASARRFLVMFMYLNDVEEGGETAFYLNDTIIKVATKTGRIIAFPPFWTHPHAGLIPISGNKYIIGSYLHFK